MKKDQTPPEQEEQKVEETQTDASTDAGQGDEQNNQVAPEAAASAEDKEVQTSPDAGKPAEEGQANSADPALQKPGSGMKDGKPYDFEAGYKQLHGEYTKLTQNVKPLQEFYEQNSALVAALDRHPEILDALIDAEKNIQVTPETVDQMVESKLSARDKAAQDKAAEEALTKEVNTFVAAHPEFKDPTFSQRFYAYFEETGAKLNSKSMQYAFDALTKTVAAEKAREEARTEAEVEEAERQLARVGSESAAAGDSAGKKKFFGGFPVGNPNMFHLQN